MQRSASSGKCKEEQTSGWAGQGVLSVSVWALDLVSDFFCYNISVVWMVFVSLDAWGVRYPPSALSNDDQVLALFSFFFSLLFFFFFKTVSNCIECSWVRFSRRRRWLSD